MNSFFSADVWVPDAMFRLLLGCGRRVFSFRLGAVQVCCARYL